MFVVTGNAGSLVTDLLQIAHIKVVKRRGALAQDQPSQFLCKQTTWTDWIPTPQKQTSNLANQEHPGNNKGHCVILIIKMFHCPTSMKNVLSVSSFRSFIGDSVAHRLEFLIQTTSLTSSAACSLSQRFSVLQHSGASPASSFPLAGEYPQVHERHRVYPFISWWPLRFFIFSSFVINTVIINLHFMRQIFHHSMTYAYAFMDVLHTHPFSMEFLCHMVTLFNTLTLSCPNVVHHSFHIASSNISLFQFLHSHINSFFYICISVTLQSVKQHLIIASHNANLEHQSMMQAGAMVWNQSNGPDHRRLFLFYDIEEPLVSNMGHKVKHYAENKKIINDFNHFFYLNSVVCDVLYKKLVSYHLNFWT